MGKNAPDVQSVPDYYTGTAKIGGATSTTTKDGNNITSSYTAAPGEQQSYDYIQQILPNLSKNATQSGNFDSYVKKYTENQDRELEKDYGRSLNKLKGTFVTSGKMGDSSSLDKIGQVNNSYLDSLAKVNAEAPSYAQQLRENDQTYNTNALNNAQNSLNSYYSLGQNMNQSSLGLSNQGNQWGQQNYLNRRLQSQDQYNSDQANNNATMNYINAGMKGVGTAAQIAAMFL